MADGSEVEGGGRPARRLADVLSANRSRFYVERPDEREILDRLLSEEGPLRVLYIHGPGGVGKSSLLDALARRAEEAGWPVARNDARLVPPEPGAARTALALARDGSDAPEERGHLILVDTFENWAALEGWLREEWLPGLSGRDRVVVAGRRPPTLSWRTDPSWHQILEEHELEPFAESEARDYLARRGVAPSFWSDAIRIARGLPLTLALIADAAPMPAGAGAEGGNGLSSRRFGEILLETLGKLVPSDPRSPERLTLYAAALTSHVDPATLGHVLELGERETSALCRWLDSLSFVERGASGWILHDLVRGVLRGELERRPALRLHLLDRAVDDLLRRASGGGAPALRAILEGVHLFLGFLPPVQGGVQPPAYPDTPRREELPALRAMIERHEGEGQRRLFDLWWEREPAGLTVVRGSERELLGFYQIVRLRDPPAAWLEADDLARILWDERDRLARPLAPGEGALLLRSWMHVDAHMKPSPVGPVWGAAFTARLQLDPDLVFGAAVTPDDAVWRAHNRLVGHREIEASRRSLGDQRVVLAMHDHSEEGPVEWLRGIYRRFRAETAAVPLAVSPGAVSTRMARDALRNLNRPDRLADHPLLERFEEGGDRVATLQRWIRAECLALAENPRTEVLHRVLDRAYLHPEPDQRAAAEACHLSWDQYRRRLTEAIKLLATRLQQGS